MPIALTDLAADLSSQTQSGPSAPADNAPAPDARSRLLDAAARLICARGVGATGIDAVIAEAGVAKATLYRAFGSKERLVEAVLDRHSLQWSAWFNGRLDAAEGPPAKRLLHVFDLLAEWFAAPDFRGCPILNAIGEGPDIGEGPRRVASLHKGRLAPRLLALAREAGADDPEALVEALLLLMDGAIVVAMAGRNPLAAATAREAFAAMLRDRLGPGAVPG